MALIETATQGRGTREWVVDVRQCPPLRDHRIRAAGVSRLGDGYRFVRRDPTFAHVSVCCGGRLAYLSRQRWRSVGPGTALLAPAGAPHGARPMPASRGRACRMAWVVFDDRAGAVAPVPAGIARVQRGVDYRPLVWAIRGLHREARRTGEPRVMRHWVDLLWTAVTRIARAAHDSRGPSVRLMRVWDAVDAELARPWTIDDLADLASVSPTHLRRLCRAALGHGPARELARLRMARAAVLLETTDRKLATIADAVGYANVFAFSAAFRRVHGTWPDHWRRRHRPRA